MDLTKLKPLSNIFGEVRIMLPFDLNLQVHLETDLLKNLLFGVRFRPEGPGVPFFPDAIN